MSPIKGNKTTSARSGFTLAEVLVGIFCASFVMLSTVWGYTFVARNLTRTANTQFLEASSRRALALFSADVSAASEVKTSTATTLELTLPVGTKTFLSNGTVSTLSAVTYVKYTYTAGANNTGKLTRTVNNVAPPASYPSLLSYLSGCSFNYFTATATTPATSITPISVKQVEMVIASSFASSKTSSTDNLKKSTYSAVSPRVTVGNRSLLQ